MSSFDLGKTDLIEHEINSGGHPPIKQPPPRVPPHQREIVDKQLDKLLASGRVEESQSPWSSPVVLARKHDGSYRVCIDFRKLNQSTEKGAIPLPRIDDVLEAVGGAQWLIRTAGLKLKLTKCQFLKTEVKFLGHVFSTQWIKTDPEKIETVKTWPRVSELSWSSQLIQAIHLWITRYCRSALQTV